MAAPRQTTNTTLEPDSNSILQQVKDKVMLFFLTFQPKIPAQYNKCLSLKESLDFQRQQGRRPTNQRHSQAAPQSGIWHCSSEMHRLHPAGTQDFRLEPAAWLLVPSVLQRRHDPARWEDERMTTFQMQKRRNRASYFL